MAVIPPGNKQIGEFSTVSTYQILDNITSTKSLLLNGFSVTQPSVVPIEAPANTFQIGEYTTVVTSEHVLDSLSVKNRFLNGFAVVKQLETFTIDDYLTNAFTVVSRPPEELPPTTPLKSVFIGEYTTNVTSQMVNNITKIRSNVINAFVVVKFVRKRKETTTFNVSLHTEKLDFNAF